jgi:HD-GYP domain-containing protein (c-di-GMP phosphodiesterase class II)
MQLAQGIVDGIRIAGYLHDIGKVAIPAEILAKPGSLNAYELGIMRSHPQFAYDVLKDLEFNTPVAKAILQHHERLDGSGYPMGASKDDIILEARILGVADVVEAMSSHRPYRAALGIDSALWSIAAGKGLLYDVEVVDACLKLFAKGFKLD